MRNAFLRRTPSGKALQRKHHVLLDQAMRLGVVALVSAAVVGCASDTTSSEAGALSDDAAKDVNWSFANVGLLQMEIDGLRSENEQLKAKLKDLSEENKRIGTQLSELQVNGPKVLKGAEGTIFDNQANAAAGSSQAVVAAAQLEEAVPEPPVEASPRLVQPSFSDEKPVFENEATGNDIKLSSVLYGVHLASYRQLEEARSGWRKLQRENPEELGLLEPRVERVTVKNRGEYIRLIGGGFSSQDRALSLCRRLELKSLYCKAAGYSGERLSLADASY